MTGPESLFSTTGPAQDLESSDALAVLSPQATATTALKAGGALDPTTPQVPVTDMQGIRVDPHADRELAHKLCLFYLLLDDDTPVAPRRMILRGEELRLTYETAADTRSGVGEELASVLIDYIASFDDGPPLPTLGAQTRLGDERITWEADATLANDTVKTRDFEPMLNSVRSTIQVELLDEHNCEED